MGDGIRFLALYELESEAAVHTPEYLSWKEQSASTSRMSSRFTARVRHLYRKTFDSASQLQKPNP